MLYNEVYFKKRLMQSYMDTRFGRKGSFLIGFLLGVFGIALNSFFLPLSSTVAGELFPQVVDSSFFAVAHIYTALAVLFFGVYLLKNYESATFAEIKQNRWYMLRKAGYSPANIAFSKTTSLFSSIVIIYTVGFIVALLLAMLLKMNIVFTVLIGLFVTGMLRVLALCSIITFFSLFLKNKKIATMLFVTVLILDLVVETQTGMYDVYSSVFLMRELKNIFTGIPSIYTYLQLGATVLALVLGSVIAVHYSKFYNPQSRVEKSILFRDYKTKRIKTINSEKGAKTKKAFIVVAKVAFFGVFVLGLVLNLVIVGASMTTSSKEFSVGTVMPYVFDSGTMAPEIAKNDLVFFKKTADNHEYKLGDIVIFSQNSITYVQKIIEINSDEKTYLVDILDYPEGSTLGGMKKTIKNADINGVYSGRSRWLGAFILLAQSAFGKLVFLILPLVVLIFYEQLSKLIRATKKAFKELK